MSIVGTVVQVAAGKGDDGMPLVRLGLAGNRRLAAVELTPAETDELIDALREALKPACEIDLIRLEADARAGRWGR